MQLETVPELSPFDTLAILLIQNCPHRFDHELAVVCERVGEDGRANCPMHQILTSDQFCLGLLFARAHRDILQAQEQEAGVPVKDVVFRD